MLVGFFSIIPTVSFGQDCLIVPIFALHLRNALYLTIFSSFFINEQGNCTPGLQRHKCLLLITNRKRDGFYRLIAFKGSELDPSVTAKE